RQGLAESDRGGQTCPFHRRQTLAEQVQEQRGEQQPWIGPSQEPGNLAEVHAAREIQQQPDADEQLDRELPAAARARLGDVERHTRLLSGKLRNRNGRRGCEALLAPSASSPIAGS